MTDLRKAAQQALEALEWAWGGEPLTGKEMVAIAALRAALAEPEQPYDQTALDLCPVCGWRTLIPGDACLNCERSKQPEQEPKQVAWNWMLDGQPHGPPYYGPLPDDDVLRIGLANGRSVRLLYTAPTPRKPLTNEEISAILDDTLEGGSFFDVALAVARAIERAHGIGGGE